MAPVANESAVHHQSSEDDHHPQAVEYNQNETDGQ